MTTKEKAEAYDLVLERAKKWYNAPNIDKMPTYGSRIIEEIFLELKESEGEDENEKIRKEIIEYIKTGTYHKSWIAWLEKQGNPTDINPSEFDLRINKLLKQFETLPKEELASSLSFYLNVVQNDGTYREEKQGEQKPAFEMKSAEESLGKDPETYNKIMDECIYGEQKPADKIAPKFKVGDWVVSPNGVYWHIDRIENNRYEVTSDTGKCADWPLDTDLYHLWSIEDAKNGDVLADNLGIILFKSIKDNNVINYYAYLSGLFSVQKDEEYWGFAINCKLSPATKEQRERFFAAMHDAGYEWDADKLELYKKPKFKVGEWITDGQLTCKVLSVTGKSYELHLYNDDYCHFETGVQSVDKHYHLWTIQDTHDGDVLTSIGFHSNCTFIFKGLDNWKFDEPNGDRAVATGYCCLSVSSDKMEFGIQGPDCVEVNTIKPATKIQRDLLFQKMKESGYEWDAEKKELRKIENEIPFGARDSELHEVSYYIPEGYYAEIDDDGVIIKKGKKPTAWSGEDNTYYDDICEILINLIHSETAKVNKDVVQRDLNWLTSIKQRIVTK